MIKRNIFNKSKNILGTDRSHTYRCGNHDRMRPLAVAWLYCQTQYKAAKRVWWGLDIGLLVMLVTQFIAHRLASTIYGHLVGPEVRLGCKPPLPPRVQLSQVNSEPVIRLHILLACWCKKCKIVHASLYNVGS